jgi:hypothetical protein
LGLPLKLWGGRGEKRGVLSPTESKTIYFKEKLLNNIHLSTGALETLPLSPFPPKKMYNENCG